MFGRKAKRRISIADVWAKSEKTYQHRLTGTLGEVLFADAFGLERPMRSFGAAGGQDYGSDFVLGGRHIDVKTIMQRVSSVASNYNQNINTSQIDAPNSKTDNYIFIRLCTSGWAVTCFMVGSIDAAALKARKAGILRHAGEVIKRDNGASWSVERELIDIKVADLNPIRVTASLSKMPNFKILAI